MPSAHPHERFLYAHHPRVLGTQHANSCLFSGIHSVWRWPLHVRRKALEAISPRVLRIMFTLAPWDRAMTYSDTAVSEAQRKEEVFRSFFARIDALLKKFSAGVAPPPPAAAAAPPAADMANPAPAHPMGGT